MEDKRTPDLFNLVDLVLTSLKSRSQQTVSATLKLVSTILRKHHPYSISTLLKVVPVPDGARSRTIGAHNKEMELFFSLVGDISEDGDVSESYGEHLKDNLVLLESHPCSAKILALKDPAVHYGACEDPEPKHPWVRDMYTHTIHPNDLLLKSVVESLNTFFSNTVETNLVLTAVIVDLATCSWMRPEGWLLFDPECYEFDDSDDGGDDEWDQLEDAENELAEIMGDGGEDVFARKERKRIKELKRANREPRWKSTPPILRAIQGLVAQIQIYRREIPDLDDKLVERKHAFQFTDDLNDALLSSPRSPSFPIRNPILDSISQKNLARPPSATQSQAPRGRQPPGGSDYSSSKTPRVPGRAMMPTPSPARGISPSAAPVTAGSPSSPFNNHVLDTTQRRIKVLQPGQAALHLPPPPEGESREGSVIGTETPPIIDDIVGARGDFTLSHLLTNIMILQVWTYIVPELFYLISAVVLMHGIGVRS